MCGTAFTAECCKKLAAHSTKSSAGSSPSSESKYAGDGVNPVTVIDT